LRYFCALHKNILEIAAPLLYCALQHKGVVPMATKMDSAEKAFEAATLETPAKPVATPAAPAVAAPSAEKIAAAPVKTPTEKAKAKPVQKKAAKSRSEEGGREDDCPQSPEGRAEARRRRHQRIQDHERHRQEVR
jgi:hypothetical protein